MFVKDCVGGWSHQAKLVALLNNDNGGGGGGSGSIANSKRNDRFGQSVEHRVLAGIVVFV